MTITFDDRGNSKRWGLILPPPFERREIWGWETLHQVHGVKRHSNPQPTNTSLLSFKPQRLLLLPFPQIQSVNKSFMFFFNVDILSLQLESSWWGGASGSCLFKGRDWLTNQTGRWGGATCLQVAFTGQARCFIYSFAWPRLCVYSRSPEGNIYSFPLALPPPSSVWSSPSSMLPRELYDPLSSNSVSLFFA